MSRARLLALIAFVLLALPEPVRALECTYTSSGLWSDPTHWSCGVVPGNGDHAILPGGRLVTVDAPVTVDALTLSGVQLTVAATLTVTTTLTWQSGFVIGGNGAAMVLAAGSTSTRTGGTLHTNAVLENRGTMTYTGALPSGSGTFDNSGTGLLVLAGTLASERIVNSGIVRKTTASTCVLTGRVESSGTLDVQAGTLVLNGTGGPNVIAGPVVVGAGATLQSTGAGVTTNYTAGASIAGAGALVVGSNQNIVADTTWSVASVTLSGGSLTTVSGDLTITGSFAWTGGFIVGGSNRRVVLATTVTGMRTGGTLHTDAILENRGTMTYTGALPSGSGTFDNVSPGLLVLAGTLASERIVNSGIVRKTTAATFTHGHTLASTGTLHVQEGTLVLSGGANTVGGALNVGDGTVLRLNNSSTLQAGLTFTGTGVLEFAATVQVLSAYAHPGLTRVVGSQAVFDNAASVTFAALTHTGGFLDIQRPTATITGPFTRTGGTLRTSGNTLTFAGTGAQLLDLSVASTFANLAVSPATTLVEVQAANNASVSGTLTNLGVIRKTRSMAGGSNAFGLTGALLNVAALGSLSSVQIDRRDVTHPSAGPEQQTGRYWTMTPVGAGFDLSVTLPHAVADHQSTSACRFTGAAWDCARTSSAAGQVTRAGVTTLSDWAVGVGAGQTYSITGTIQLNGATPMSGVSVQLSGASTASTTTNASGVYTFSGLSAGTYTVSPSVAGHVFTPTTRTFTSIAANQTGNFTGEKVWAITGTVRDLNDTGVAGVAVNVTGSATRATVTNADGEYAFADLPDGGTYTVTPTQPSFVFTPQSQVFANLASDRVAAFFLAEVGSFTRYFAEGATSAFFETEIALLNATGQATTATLTFLKGDGTTVAHDVPLAGLARATVTPKQLPGLDNAEFSTVITSSQPVIADRTMRWDARGYGSHAETSIAAPALEWYLAEGATIGGFNLFYLLQNPNPTTASVEVTYLLPAPQAPIVKAYTITPNTRFNIWVNLEAPELAAAEVSAVIRGTNNIPVIVERAMYRNNGGRTFDAGHESAGVTAPATEWFLAEGATGDYFDLFVLIANPQTTPAQVSVDYLLPGGTVLTRTYSVAPQSRFNIWVDFEDPQLASTAVSARVRSTNAVPIIVERAMWWPGDGSTWHEGHNSAGAERTSTKWGLADGQVGGPFSVETYILIANTSSTGGTAQVTLVFEDGTTAVRQITLLPNSRESVPVSLTFPEAAGRRFGAVVESFGPPAPEIVVERAMYGNAEGVVWAAGSNVVGTRLR
ncbi:SdrD B-like domain-containing protein [Luteitalea sp.]|uniref:beta strand repeat-containing protein n=1 Tax=Luteitalea sp. TaxID=2004800 RepID=UPI0025B976E2|nr:SdrD B-like domain-containing protein [Luteitalea sp.]